jgi:hypothetical protein
MNPIQNKTQNRTERKEDENPIRKQIDQNFFAQLFLADKTSSGSTGGAVVLSSSNGSSRRCRRMDEKHPRMNENKQEAKLKKVNKNIHAHTR